MSEPFGRLRRFFRELKRRNVYRVAVTYVAVAFVGFQAARLLIPSTVLPSWSDEFFLFFLIIGFPVALVVAWAFEMTPEGMQRTPEAGPAEEGVSEAGQGLSTGYKVLVGLGLVAAAVAGGWYLTGGGGKSPEISEGTVAVLPFQVSGSGAETWRDGMVSLLSTGLDEVAGLRAVADRTILATWRESGFGQTGATTKEALTVARKVGAKYAVIGSATSLGSELQLSAQVRTTKSGRQLDQVEARGASDSVTALAHELTRRLIGVLAQETGEKLRTADLASVTTRSASALTSYLAAERHSRAGEFAAAVNDYRSAVAQDSTFALAYWQLANVAGWVEPGAGSQFLPHAYRLIDQLPRRERRLVRAAYLWRYSAHHVAAADSLRRLTEDYPDDPAVWYELGRLLFHAGLPGGWPEADRALGEAVELDPGHARYQVHYLHLAIALHHDSALAAERWEGHPNPKSVEPWYPLALRLAFGTSEKRRETLARIAANKSLNWGGLAYSLSHPEDGDEQAQVLRRAPEGMDRSREIVHNLLRRGQVSKAWDAVRTAPTDAVIACGLVDAMSLGYPLPDSVLEAYMGPSLPPEEASLERFLCEGIYLIEREQDRALDRLVTRLQEVAADTVNETIRRRARARNAAAIVRGYRAWKAGEPRRAAELLTSVIYRPNVLTFSWHGIWRGDVFRELGQLEQAEGWYLTAWWHPLAHQRLGRVYEQMGKPKKAAAAYRRFIEGWKNADEELQPRVEAARKRLKELTASEAERDD